MVVAVLGGGGHAYAQGKPSSKAAPGPQISKNVRKALVAAQKAATEQKWPECISNANDANAVADKTPYDFFVINDILGFCKIRVNDMDGAMAAFEVVANSEFSDAARREQLTKAVMQLAYNAKQYPKAIDYGMRLVCGQFCALKDTDAVAEHMQRTRRRNRRVKLAQSARCRIARIDEGFAPCLHRLCVHGLETGPTHIDFTAYFQPGWKRCAGIVLEAQRHIADGAHIVGNVLARDTIATRGGPQQSSVFVQ